MTKKFAQELLSTLKQQYPINRDIYLTCYNRQTLTSRLKHLPYGAFAYVDRRELEAFIHVGVQTTLPELVRLMAHEYYHCIQKYLLNKPDQYDGLEPEAEAFAADYLRYFLFTRTGKQLPLPTLTK